MPTVQEFKGTSRQTIQKFSMEEEVEPEKLVQFVVFALAGEEYGLGILDVKEIVKTAQITTVPNMPDFIKGVINLRGRIVVVIDLAKRFFLQDKEADTTGKHIVITIVKENMFGLLVDEVTEVLRLPEKSIKVAPKLITEKMDSKYLTGVGTIDERLVVLLDISKVLSDEELVKLSKTSGTHYQKIKSKEKVQETKPEKKKEELESKDE